jgi:phosphoribosylformylglycinamidine cyclo-ligase
VSDATVRYSDAGVDLEAARAHTAGIASLVQGGVGGFAGVMALPQMRDGLIVGCTDGVGTKVLLARELDWIDGLGQDLVAMSVNDLVCTGATPLFFLDYLAVGKLDPGEAKLIVAAVSEACRESGCALIGGETAEMPGLYQPGHFDMAGFACGLVERDGLLGPSRVVAGDVIVGLHSSGIHSNGFSLVRRLVDSGALAADRELLTPTRLYPATFAALHAAGVELHAAAHITGGGLPENLPRVLPEGLEAVVREGSWPLNPAIQMLVDCGSVRDDDLWDTFNMGIGMCLVVPAGEASKVLEIADGASVIGEIRQGSGGLVRA